MRERNGDRAGHSTEEQAGQTAFPHLPRVTRVPDRHASRGDRLRAAHEGPTGDWFVHIKDAENQAWAGRDLLAVLSELLELPHGKREDWVYEAIRQLAGRETPLGTRYACPCCDFLTLTRPPSGTYAGCPVCVWEDDGAQFEDLDYAGGANKVSLRQAREDFRREGVSELRLRHLARRPHLEEHP